MAGFLAEAQNPETAPERLRSLASQPEIEVRRAVAGNPNTPEDVLLRLAVHFPEAVLGNPVLDLLLLVNANWLAEIPGYARHRLLGCPLAPSHFLRWAVREGDYSAALSLLQNPAAPAALVEPLTQHPWPAVEEAARLHVALETSPLERALWWCEVDMDYLELHQLVLLGMAPAWILPRMARELDTSLRLTLIQQENLPKEVLEAFLFDGEEEVRKAARQHPTTPRETILLLDRLEAQLAVEIPFETLAQGHYWVRQLVAQHPQTPPHLLQRFLTDDDWRVRGAAARNPALPAHWLEQLAQDGDHLVRQWVAANPNTPGSSLERLVGDEYEEVCQAAAENPSTPRWVLELLERARAQDGALTPEELGRLAQAGQAARRLAAVHPNTDSEILERCHDDPDWHTRMAVAYNPKTPPAILAAMAADTDPEVRQAVAVHPSTPLESLEVLAGDEQPDVRVQMAQNLRTPQNLLLQLAHDDHWRVRQAVAANLATPVLVLEQLAHDPDRDVRQAVANHPQVPEAALESLFAGRFAGLNPQMSLVELYQRIKKGEPLRPDLLDKLAQGNDWARHLAARHPFTPAETLRTLACDEDWRVRQAAATNPGLAADVLLQLSSDPHGDVRRAVVRHPQTTEELLERLCVDDQQDIRWQVALDPRAPLPALRILLTDSDEMVRLAAQTHPETPADLIEQYRRAEAIDPGLEGEFLRQLAGQTIWSRVLAAQNPATPLEALHELVRDLEWSVRQAVAMNPALTAELLVSLAQDPEREVRQAVAEHRHTPQALLSELLHDIDENVRLSALRNPHLDAQTLEHYRARLVLRSSRSHFALNRAVALSRPEIPARELSKVRHWAAPEWVVRYAVAQNPKTPVEVLERLAQDGSRLVRARAAQSLELRGKDRKNLGGELRDPPHPKP
jgi:hypothetical protein